ncbi:hypothetical protein QYF61_002469 [Mycteria americana]|uniref:Uncharacterized protein n=1 Tax=Mycteria americana TaxID=33587 RepID=A0AAN7S1Y4_MYCAM|nr:hypothetical protein QYF61_002469 [Mycteria americana]
MSVFWVDYRALSFDACFAQLYFVHSFSFMESSVLLAMAFDRYVAICYLLRYSSILTSARIAKIGLTALLPFCQSHVLSHVYRLHQDLIKLTIASIAPQREHLKALNNCLSRILAVLILYIPMAGLSTVHCFSKHASPLIHVLLANIYLLVPPVLNPIIYSIKTKQICRTGANGEKSNERQLVTGEKIGVEKAKFKSSEKEGQEKLFSVCQVNRPGKTQCSLAKPANPSSPFRLKSQRLDDCCTRGR